MEKRWQKLAVEDLPDAHVFEIVGEPLAAIQADNVGLPIAPALFRGGNRPAEAAVGAAEEKFE